MCSLGPGDQLGRRGLSRGSRFSEFDINALVTKELDYLPPMEATLPVSPQYQMRSRWRGSFLWCRRGPT